MVFGRRGSAVFGIALVGCCSSVVGVVAVLVALVLLASVLVVLPGVRRWRRRGMRAYGWGECVGVVAEHVDGQSAVKAVDGWRRGIRGMRRGVGHGGWQGGSWIQLVWSSPVTIDRVVLYDRPNVTSNRCGRLKSS